jgi:hypothetical protein
VLVSPAASVCAPLQAECARIILLPDLQLYGLVVMGTIQKIANILAISTYDEFLAPEGDFVLALFRAKLGML